MAPEDRNFEPNFEKALARHLRSEAPQPSACADAETLAAYHERLLAPHELASWKQHIASCERCQEILAQLEVTDEIPLDSIAEHDAHVVAMPAREHGAAVQVAVSLQAAEPVQMRPASASSAKPRRTSWRLLVPAGALAAGLLVWIVSREEHLQQRILEPSQAPARISDATSAPASAAPAKVQPQTVQAQEERVKSLGESKAKQDLTRSTPAAPKAEGRLFNEKSPAALADAAKPNEALSSDLRKDAPLRSRVGAGAAGGPSNRALQQQAANNVDLYQKAPASELKRDGRATDQLDKDSGIAVAGAQPAPPPPPAAAEYAATAPAPALQKSAAAKKAERQEADAKLSTQSETVIVTGQAAMFAASMSVVGGQRVLPVQGTKIIWKIDDDGRVRRTTDAGESWKEQDTGVSATLFSGSAPSEKVCWLVGTFGTVLLTTDGGVHWNKVAAPTNSTINRIDATDARHAVVTLQSSAVQFETFDAGQTWSLVKKKK